MATAAIVGSTGLVGGFIYSTLTTRPEIKTVYAFSRKQLTASDKLKAIQSSETDSWPSQYPADAEIFFSGLGTTRAAAGGFDKQYKIDHDLNLELAKAAKAAGTKHYVLISSAGANSSSMMSYMKMKGQLEDDVKALGFDHCVILQPGLLVGSRNDMRLAEWMLQRVAVTFGMVNRRLKDPWAQDAEVIARAAVKAGLDCVEGREQPKVRIIGQAEIIKLGRTEWTVQGVMT